MMKAIGKIEGTFELSGKLSCTDIKNVLTLQYHQYTRFAVFQMHEVGMLHRILFIVLPSSTQM